MNEKELEPYRVWPDGTVQDTSEEPYRWMSDDLQIVYAKDEDEDEALLKAGV